MGTYAINTNTKLTLDLAKLQQGYLNRSQEFLALMADWEIDVGKKSFQECCEGLGHKSKMFPEKGYMSITQLAEESKVGWQDTALPLFAPFALEGDYVEFQCPEYGTWRYILHGGKFIEQRGTVTVTYPPLPVLPEVKAKRKRKTAKL